jgi:hypothetical protein
LKTSCRESYQFGLNKQDVCILPSVSEPGRLRQK